MSAGARIPDPARSATPNSGKYSELPIRIASAIVLASCALAATWMGGVLFSILAAAISALIFYEFTEMVGDRLQPGIKWSAAVCLALSVLLVAMGHRNAGLMVLLLTTFCLGSFEFFKSSRLWGATALFYSGAPFIALITLRDGQAGIFDIIFIMACVWGADTFAYFSGKSFGGPKLAPRISPNKTWSGALGGLLGAVVIGSLLAIGFGYSVTAAMLLFSLTLAIISQMGDLFESWIKRRFGVKDSGKLIPGHGGILDRIDGLIFALILAWLIGIMLSNGLTDSLDLSMILEANFFYLPR